MWGSDGQATGTGNGNGNQGGSWSRTVRSADGSTVFTFGGSNDGGGGPPPMFGAAAAGFPVPGAGFGVGVSASSGPGGGAWGSSGFDQTADNGRSIALDKKDQACFARLRILEVMARAPFVLNADECLAALRAAFIDLNAHWPADWPQKEPHQNFLTAVYQAAKVMVTTTDVTIVRSVSDKIDFPSESHATKITWCLTVILRRLRELSFYRLSKPASDTPVSEEPSPLGKWLQDN